MTEASVRKTWRGNLFMELPAKAMNKVEIAAKIMLADAKEHCPVLHGTMRDTGDIARDDREGVIVVGFGGPSAPYTYKQHENLAYHHPGGEAKWLENAMNRHRENIKKAAKDGIKEG